MAKILVTPVAESGVPPKEYEGTLTYRYFQGDGGVYYIAGDSFPEEIVTVLEE